MFNNDPIKAIPCGTKVEIGNGIEGRIVEIRIRGNSEIEYVVAWFSGGKRETACLTDLELDTVNFEDLTAAERRDRTKLLKRIGFRSPQE